MKRTQGNLSTSMPGLLLLGLSWLGVTSLTTQFVAESLHFHPALGPPIFGKVYGPWAWLIWQAAFYKSAPMLFNWVYIGYLVSVAGLLDMCC
jgi:type IV secretion system protein VirD4